MANLATDFTFTNGSDFAIDLDDGIFNENTQVDTLNGNDTILGSGGYTGIQNNGEINTGRGNDLIIGQGNGNGIYLDNSSTTLNTGDGSDLIAAYAGDVGYGIFNYGTIDTGRGRAEICAK
jgi:hypothetical protein